MSSSFPSGLMGNAREEYSRPAEPSLTSAASPSPACLLPLPRPGPAAPPKRFECLPVFGRGGVAKEGNDVGSNESWDVRDGAADSEAVSSTSSSLDSALPSR
jgi:hypothetical protein